MEDKPIYSFDVVTGLELGWGEGWLSPGGKHDVTELVAKENVAGKTVLDIGAGTGGPALLLVEAFGAGHVTGIDVEQLVVKRAKALAAARGLEGQMDFRCVLPGKLPFQDASFDLIFSKDAFVHISDKAQLCTEMFRVLVPGGVCLFSDWCCGMPPYSQEMMQFLNNGMNFTMATIEENRRGLEVAGFQKLTATDRNEWFAKLAAQEFNTISGPKRAALISKVGNDHADRLIAAARRRATIAAQGHLRPAHFTARKPAD